MNKDDLQKLRVDIVARTQALALNGDVNENDKLAVLMNIVRSGNGTDDVIKATFDTIEHLPDDNSKLETYLDLLYEVDQLIASNSSPTETTNLSPEQEVNQTVPTEEDNYQAS